MYFFNKSHNRAFFHRFGTVHWMTGRFFRRFGAILLDYRAFFSPFCGCPLDDRAFFRRFGAGKLLVDLFLSCFGIYSACGSKIDNWVGWFARYGSYVFIGSSRCLSSLKRTYSLIVSPTKRARLNGPRFLSSVLYLSCSLKI